jgi:hypothetical protein
MFVLTETTNFHQIVHLSNALFFKSFKESKYSRMEGHLFIYKVVSVRRQVDFYGRTNDYLVFV